MQTGTLITATLVNTHTAQNYNPTTELLQRVLNTSPVRHTEYWCNTCSVWRECTNTSVTYVTYERSISANPFISSERTPCPVPQSCTAGSDDKKIVLQKHAYSVHMWQNNIFCINGERLILYPLPSFLLNYEASDFMLQVDAFVNLIKEARFFTSTRLEWRSQHRYTHCITSIDVCNQLCLSDIPEFVSRVRNCKKACHS